MQLPAVAKFPAGIWNGLSETRSTLTSHVAPTPEDVAQMIAEIIAVETAVSAADLGTAGTLLTTTATIAGAGNVAALTTTATSGHKYFPTCAGTPTGVPATKTGYVASVFDTTGNKLWVYDGGWITVPEGLASIVQDVSILTTITAAANQAAIALEATSGHQYLATCAGTPSGVPTAKTGFCPTIYDSSTDKIWVYNGSAWKSTAALTAPG